MYKLRVAIFGLAHPHAAALTRAFKALPDEVEIIGYAEVGPCDDQTPEERYRNIGKQADDLERFEDWHRLLALEPDVAVVATENSICADIACEILKKGISVINEKPMAMNYADAKRMAEAAKASGAHVITNWPIAWFPSFNLAKKLLDDGVVGKPMRVVYRSPATWGPYSYGKNNTPPPIEWLNKTWWYRKECGGGSLLDYACYGAILTTYMFGKKALRVSGITKQFCTAETSVEDYSAMILDFGDGVGLLEGSWSSFNPAEIPSGPIIYGTEGVIVCDRHSNLLKIYKGNSHAPIEPVEVIDCSEMPELKTDLGRNILDFLLGNGKLHPMLETEINLAVCATLDAGRRSAEQGITADVE